MSHAYLVVLMPPSVVNFDSKETKIWEVVNKLDKSAQSVFEAAVSSYIGDKMAPYSENLEVDEYSEKCWCVDVESNSAAREAAEKKFGPFDNIRKAYRALPVAQQTDETWEKMCSSYNEYEREFELAHPMHGKAKQDCSECLGSGTRKTTYNPKSKWDWYVIGGRWNGVLTRNERNDTKGGFNFDDEFHTLSENMAMLSSLAPLTDKDVPHAILTPDGEWNEHGEMGWWGIMKDGVEKDTWKQQALTILNAHLDHFAIGVDYHI